MAFIHGKNANITVSTKDVSAYANNVEFKQSADSHDTTTFGKGSKVYTGGLKDGTCTIEGVYDNTATTGPAAALRPLLGTVVELVYSPEGTGTGKPIRTVDGLMTSYEETAPVGDMVTWSAEFQLSDDVADSTGV